jgi:hypothetical protein
MGKVKDIYRNNIYGVITTLCFHIILLILLLTLNLKYDKKYIEDAIIMDFRNEVPKLQDSEKEHQQANTSGSQQMPGSNLLASNRAVNEANKSGSRTNDPFFDKAYNNEVAAAKKLASDVNKNLARKIPEIGDIRMPEENTRGKTREEVKQLNFKGKSNIHYLLENRFHVRLPIPVYLAEGGGEVIVDIVVGRDGRVLEANPRQNTQFADPTVLAYAKQAAEKTWFNEDTSAPEKQKGTITYRFVAQ